MKEKIRFLDDVLERLDKLIEEDKLPQIILFKGERGGGKTMVAKYIAEKLDADIILPEETAKCVTTEYMKKVVNLCSTLTKKTIILLPYIEKYEAIRASNTLLKVLEEPPKNVYFICTAQVETLIPHTIRSRIKLKMNITYSNDQLRRYAKELGYDLPESQLKLLNVPHDVVKFGQAKIGQDEFVTKCVNNIGKVEGANVFNVANHIAFAVGDDGYELIPFWIAFKQKCLDIGEETKNSKRSMYFSYIRVTTQYLDKLHLKGLNKRALFDLWLLEIRDIYNKYNN